jgi:molybdate transport system substrate-binding protein
MGLSNGKKGSRAFLLFFTLLIPASVPAAEVSIAAAASLVSALHPLNAEFQRTHPGVKVTGTTGASGSLVAQIMHGAPYDVFLSADRDYAEKLIKAGGAVPTSLKAFATGRLVLWTTRPGVPVTTVEALITYPTVRKVAVANPKTAPYGRAAVQALNKLGLFAAAGPKLVQGENISQAAQFVETGNADAGFVAMSLVLSPQLRTRGRWLEIAPDLYDALTQAAVITTHGAANSAAQDYLAFLGSREAGRILERFGYRPPPRGEQ